MKIKILKGCLVEGEHCAKGDVVEVLESDGQYLISSGIAEKSGSAKSKKDVVKRVKIVVTQACLIAGRHVSKGDTLTAVADDVSYLLARGQALKASSDEAKSFLAELKKEAEAAAKAAAKAAA